MKKVLNVKPLRSVLFFCPMTIIIFFCIMNFCIAAGTIKGEKLSQIESGPADRREGMHDGNQIITLFYNYGSVARPNTEPSIEWPAYSGHGYAYELGLTIGAEVVDMYDDTIHIISEALIDGGDHGPGGKVWGWQPLPEHQNPFSSTPAMSNDANSWPTTWTSWQGLNGSGVVNADLESYWVMDDRDNDEFDYYPVPADTNFRGLGIEVSCRGYQWNDLDYNDFFVLHYTLKNVSNRELKKMVVGIFSDPHIGGPGDFDDDFVGYDTSEDMVWAYDATGSGNDYGIPWSDLGWVGLKILESPLDSASNELGLTSFTAPLYHSSFGDPADDEQMWANLTPGNFSNLTQNIDNVLIMGSGYFSLSPGEEKVFAVSLILAQGLGDLLNKAVHSQNAYSTISGIGDQTNFLSPKTFSLEQNFPNPFNSSTKIKFQLPYTSTVNLKVYNMLGREICALVNTEMLPGSYSVIWNGTNARGESVPSGIYIYQLISGNFSNSKKCLIVK